MLPSVETKQGMINIQHVVRYMEAGNILYEAAKLNLQFIGPTLHLEAPALIQFALVGI